MKTPIRDPAATANALPGLKRLREQAGLSQTAAAQALGVSRQAYIGWETGRTSDIKLGNLSSILALFGCTLEDLTREEAEE